MEGFQWTDLLGPGAALIPIAEADISPPATPAAALEQMGAIVPSSGALAPSNYQTYSSSWPSWLTWVLLGLGGLILYRLLD
ncbi:MAG: hypothetical protein ACRD19_07310 [Terriglobia bacterium]